MPMNISAMYRKNASESVAIHHLDYRTLSITLLGTNNQTLEGTVNLTSLISGAEMGDEPYDSKGAAYYVCAVILVYGLSIVLLIGSLAKKKMKDKGQDVEERQITQYLHKVPDLKEKSARDNYRQLKRDIITLVQTTPTSSPSVSYRAPPTLVHPHSPLEMTHRPLATLVEENSRQGSMERENEPGTSHSTVQNISTSSPAQSDPATFNHGQTGPASGGESKKGSSEGDIWLMQVTNIPPNSAHGKQGPLRHPEGVPLHAIPGRAHTVDRSPNIPRANKFHPGWPNPFEEDSNLFKNPVGRERSPRRNKSPHDMRTTSTHLESPLCSDSQADRYPDERSLERGEVSRGRSPDRSIKPMRRESRPPNLQPFSNPAVSSVAKSSAPTIPQESVVGNIKTSPIPELQQCLLKRASNIPQPAVYPPRGTTAHRAKRPRPPHQDLSGAATLPSSSAAPHVTPDSLRTAERPTPVTPSNLSRPSSRERRKDKTPSPRHSFQDPFATERRRSVSPQPPYLSPYADSGAIELPPDRFDPNQRPSGEEFASQTDPRRPSRTDDSANSRRPKSTRPKSSGDSPATNNTQRPKSRGDSPGTTHRPRKSQRESPAARAGPPTTPRRQSPGPNRSQPTDSPDDGGRPYRSRTPYSGRHGQWPHHRRSPSPSQPHLQHLQPREDDSPGHSETEELLHVTCV